MNTHPISELRKLVWPRLKAIAAHSLAGAVAVSAAAVVHPWIDPLFQDVINHAGSLAPVAVIAAAVILLIQRH